MNTKRLSSYVSLAQAYLAHSLMMRKSKELPLGSDRNINIGIYSSKTLSSSETLLEYLASFLADNKELTLCIFKTENDNCSEKIHNYFIQHKVEDRAVWYEFDSLLDVIAKCSFFIFCEGCPVVDLSFLKRSRKTFYLPLYERYIHQSTVEFTSNFIKEHKHVEKILNFSKYATGYSGLDYFASMHVWIRNKFNVSYTVEAECESVQDTIFKSIALSASYPDFYTFLFAFSEEFDKDVAEVLRNGMDYNKIFS
jgi:hypothetical protein